MTGEKLSARYEIVSELGRGGMGVVYRARDPVLNREVAVKLIAPSMLTPESEARFQTEAQLVAQMDHPSVVSIYDFGRHEGSLFFVMPIVQGNSLRDLQRKDQLTLGMVVDIGIQIAEALDYSHTRGVIHRDIKPENIMVSIETGGGVRVRVMDFGLARSTGVSNLTLTRTGVVMGTMSYISPEQVSGKTVDGRSDIYSLGSVLYECVTNEVPFSGEMQSLFYRILHELPQSPRSRGCRIDEELEQLILSCLAKDAGQRPQKAGDLARALRRYRAVMQDETQALSALASDTAPPHRSALSPFIGREQELRQLQERFNAALRGECQFVAVSGEPGIGKTRLVDELGNLAAARQVRVLHGRFVEQHGAFPYHGFCEAIQEFYRQKETGSSSSLLPDITDLAADLIALFPMLSEIPAIRDVASGISSIGGASESRSAENRNQIFELLARTLTRLARGKPLVLVFEDLHSAEVSIEALQYIVRRLGPTPTLIVATYRSTEVDRRHPVAQLLDSFHGDRRFLSCALGPLTPHDHLSFLSTLTAGNGISPGLGRRLYEATEGNPFFTKELVRSLLDAGSIAQDDTGTWSLSGGADISSAVLPATIQQAVETRIARLPDSLRGLLAVASVMGKTFEFEDLEALAEQGTGLDDAVDNLIKEGLLEEDRQSRGDRLAFASAVVREVLYAGLARRKRRQLHRKFAERLEKRYSGRLERVYPQLLYHWYEADDPERTVEYGLLYARKSLESFSPEEVIRAARTALEFMDGDFTGEPSLEGEARMLLAAGHRMSGDMGNALKETSAAVRIFEREGKPGQTIKALLAAAKAAWQVRQTEETRRWVERGIEAAMKAGETESLDHFLSLAATLANLRGEYDVAAAYLSESERLARAGSKGQPQDELPEGGHLTVGLANRIAATIPVRMQLTEEFEVLSNVFETLLQTDEEGNLHPGLCTSWEVRDEGRTFRFGLRPDVRFQDGHTLTAHDINASFQHAIRGALSDLPPAFAAILGAGEFAAGTAPDLAGIRVESDVEFEIRLKESLPIYPALLTDRRTAIVRPASADCGLPTGTGPFQLSVLERERVLLRRNEKYWKGRPSRLDSVEFRAGLSAAALAAGFRAGELDLARDLNPSDLEELLRDPRYHDCLIEAPQKFTYFILFNTISGTVTRNAAVRRALSGSLRARDLVWQSLGRFAEPATCLIPPGILGHDPGRRTPMPLLPEEARDLLRSAGLAAKTRVKAAVHPLFQDRYASLLQALLSAWAELGVEVAVETSGTESYLKAWRENENLDLIITRWKPDVDDPDSCTHALFHSGGGLMRAYFHSGETDQVLDAARRENSPAARRTLYRKFENSLLDACVLAPLFHDVGYRVCSSTLKGIELRSIQPYVNYSELGKAAPGRAVAPLRQSGGVVRVPMTRRVRNLDPMPSALVEETEVQAPIFETLMHDVGMARIEPWLASELRVEDGGRRYRFRLRSDVTFHDGRRLSARDVRFSLERLLQHKDSEARWLYAPIRGAKEVLERGGGDLSGFQIHSSTEFTIELEQPLAFFPVLLTGINLCIVPEGTVQVGNSLREGAVGTGPFRVVRFEPGVELELERNPYYWRKGFPKCDRLIFRFGVAANDILSDFKAGRLAVASDLFPADVDALRRDPSYAAGYQESPRLSVYVVGFNIHRGPLRDKALRRRLLQAVDSARIVKQTLGTLALPAHGLIPPGLLGHDALHAAAENAPSRIARESSGPDVELTAAIHPIFRAEYSAFFQEFTRSCQAAGVRIQVQSDSMAGYMEARLSGDTDIVVGRWIADYPDADTFAYMLHAPDGNFGRLCGTPETNRMISQARAETDPQARHSIYRQLEETLEREALIMPLFHEQVYRFSRPELEGLSVSYWQPTVCYENLSIRADAARARG